MESFKLSVGPISEKKAKKLSTKFVEISMKKGKYNKKDWDYLLDNLNKMDTLKKELWYFFIVMVLLHIYQRFLHSKSYISETRYDWGHTAVRISTGLCTLRVSETKFVPLYKN